MHGSSPVPTTSPSTSTSTISSSRPTPVPPTSAPTSAKKYARISMISDLPHNIRPEEIVEWCDEQPHLLQQFLSQDPTLGQLVMARNITQIRTLMMQRLLDSNKQHYKENREMEELAANPDSEEYQMKIAERIRLKNVQENRNFAMENYPQFFGQISMLYVNIEINNQPIKAFVDSGAQSTIMSASCAERCNIMRLLDVAFAGEARGVGSAKILGRINLTQMKLGNSYFPVSITVLESDSMEFLLGLDMLRRYNSCIDLDANSLRFKIGDRYEQVPFLGESELPQSGIFGRSAPVTETLPSVSGDGKMEVVEDGAFADKMTELMGMGFSEEQVRDALYKARGNVEEAAARLLGNM